ncbi:MAG: TIGR02147 family protein [Bdellovibrionia bacterium]
MDAPSIFSYQDYRDFLQALISSQSESWGLITKMAKAAQCQRPYLSKVLKGEAQLTPSQAFGLAKFWKLNGSETEYFLGLLEAERAGSGDYREYIQRKNSALRKSQEDLSKRVNRKSAPIAQDEVTYYSAWHWSAIHILVSIPEFQTVDAIARKLSLSTSIVESTLKRLEEYGFVKKESSRWKYDASERHISKNSPLSALHHANWRNRAVLDAQDPAQDSVHFTVVQTLSRADYQHLKQMLLDFIERTSRVAGPSNPEEMMCLSCDLFKS